MNTTLPAWSTLDGDPAGSRICPDRAVVDDAIAERVAAGLPPTLEQVIDLTRCDMAAVIRWTAPGSEPRDLAQRVVAELDAGRTAVALEVMTVLPAAVALSTTGWIEPQVRALSAAIDRRLTGTDDQPLD